MPIREAVALAKTVNGFFTDTATNAATVAAIARMPVLNSRRELPARPPALDGLGAPEPDRKRGTESSVRNCSLVATDRVEW
jgi:hypothetical protein